MVAKPMWKAPQYSTSSSTIALEEKTVINNYATMTKTIYNDSFLVIVDNFSHCGIVVYFSFSSSAAESTMRYKR